jgi:hypothetical protein
MLASSESPIAAVSVGILRPATAVRRPTRPDSLHNQDTRRRLILPIDLNYQQGGEKDAVNDPPGSSEKLPGVNDGKTYHGRHRECAIAEPVLRAIDKTRPNKDSVSDRERRDYRKATKSPDYISEQ